MAKNWKNVLLPPDSTIRDALQVIDSEALRVALVADQDMIFIGTVTDGDIRRGLLRGLNMDDTVAQIVNRNPKTVDPGVNREIHVEIMKKNGILCLPIVGKGKLVGLDTLQEALLGEVHENPVFLMAGGFGTRLKPLTDQCPKPLLKVGDRPILETTIIQFANQGFRNFYISTHYMPEMIREHFGTGEKWGINITYVHEQVPLGTGGALGLLPGNIPKLPLILMNGDILTNINFAKILEFHHSHGGDATMCTREFEYQVPYGVVESNSYDVVRIVEKPIQRFHVNAGIYVISPSIIQTVQKDESVDMPSLLEMEIEKGKKVSIFPIHEYWLDIGRIDDFKKAQRDISTLGIENG